MDDVRPRRLDRLAGRECLHGQVVERRHAPGGVEPQVRPEARAAQMHVAREVAREVADSEYAREAVNGLDEVPERIRYVVRAEVRDDASKNPVPDRLPDLLVLFRGVERSPL